MNILQQEDIIKGLPDQALMQEAQMPSGQVPQYLVVSEIQRRSDMRKRYKAEQEQMPQGTVKDKVMQEGIMASMPPQMAPQMAMAPQMPQRMPQMPPPQMPPQGIEQAMPPQMMSGGGIVRMANGGRAQEILDLVAVGLSPLQITQKGYEEKEITAAMGEYNRRMAPTVDPTFDGSSRIVGAPEREDSTYQRRPTGFLDDPGAIGDAVRENILEPIGSAASYISEIPGRIAQSSRMSEAKNPLSDSLLLASDMPGPFEERKTDPYGYRDVFTPEEISQRLENRPSLVDDLDMTPMEFFRQRVLGESPSGKKDASVKGRSKTQTQGVSSIMPEYTDYTTLPGMDGDSTEVVDVSQSGIATADPTKEDSKNEAGGVNLEGDGKEVQSDSVFSSDDYRSRLEYLMSLGVDSDKEVEIPTLDYSDIRSDLDRRTKSNMLFRLAEGIGKGDVASGIGGMSKVAEEAARDISKIDIAERKGQFDAATAAQKRQDSLVKTQRMLGAELMGLDAKLRVSSDTDRRELLRAYSGIRNGLQDQLVALTASGYGQTLPKSSQDLMNRIDKMLQNLAGQYGIALPAADEDGADLDDPANINTQILSRQAGP